MEIFVFLAIPRMIFSYAYGGEITYNMLFISLGVAAGLYLGFLILGGFGLHEMAKKQHLKHAWLGFLPFANTYFAGKIAGESNFFGQKMKRAGLYAMLTEIFYVGISVLTQVIEIFLANARYYIDGAFDAGTVPIKLQWMVKARPYCEGISYFAEILMVVFLFAVYFALFRKYYARGPILMAFLSSLFPFRGAVLFAVRKNTPIDYNAYVRRRMEEAMRNSQQYGGGYGGNNPPSGAPPQEAPFSEFGDASENGSSDSSSDSPFSDF